MSNTVNFWQGIREKYDAIVTKDSNTIYFITDNKEVFLDGIMISNNNQEQVDNHTDRILSVDDVTYWGNIK